MKNKSCNIRKYFVYDADTNKSICLCSISSLEQAPLHITIESEDSSLHLPDDNSDNDGAENDQPEPTKRPSSTTRSNAEINNVQRSRKRKHEQSSNEEIKFIMTSEEQELLAAHTTPEPNRCNFQLAGSKASNLKTHIRTRHPEVYEKYLEEENDLVRLASGQENGGNSFSSTPVNSSSTSSRVSQYFPRKESSSVSLFVKPKIVMDGIIEMVTVNGRSLSLINDSGFIRSFGVVLNACGIVLNKHFIKDHIKNRSLEVQNLIKTFNNRLISLKVDCATRLNRSFISINMQVVENGVMKVFNLSTIEITIHHSSENLKKMILDTLTKYNFTTKNVYSITTDNGSNFLQAVNLIYDKESTEFENPDIIEEEFDLLEPSSDVDIDPDDNETFTDSIHQLDWDNLNVISIKNTAHTMQSCIIDTLKLTVKENELETYIDVIKKARNVVKELRTQRYMMLLLEKKLPKPILDCILRWSSSHRMLGCLLALREFCDSWGLMDDKIYLSDNDWEIINELYITLEPSRKAMTKLQSDSITLTDCHKIWDLCLIKTAEIGMTFSQILVENFNKRRVKIFENDVFLASMYLDPRFQFELNAKQKEKAVKHILAIQRKVQILNIQDMAMTSDDIENINIQSFECDSMDDLEELQYELLLKQKHKEKLHEEQISHITSSTEFETIVRAFCPPRLKSNENVLKFWVNNQHIYKELYPIAEVLFGVPCTQVSAEKLFSQLRFILDPLRDCLSEPIIDDILIVRSNFKHLVD